MCLKIQGLRQFWFLFPFAKVPFRVQFSTAFKGVSEKSDDVSGWGNMNMPACTRCRVVFFFLDEGVSKLGPF